MSEARVSVASPGEPVASAGFIGRIPVRNLWLLMFYASDLWRQRGAAGVAVEDAPDELPDLVAEILAYAVERRLRRLLSRAYRRRSAPLTRVRGRIEFLKTERRQLLRRGLVSCRFEELALDTPRNRYVRAACERIARLVANPELRARCRRAAATMRALGVVGRAPGKRDLSLDPIGRHEAEDRQMVAAAALAFDLALPTEDAGSERLFRPDRDKRWVEALFEKAVRGFYGVVLEPRGWSVRVRRLRYQVEARTAGLAAILPEMKTDMTLDHRGENRRLVVDTKFTGIFTGKRYGKSRLRSAHIYQIYAYVFSQLRSDDPLSAHAEGVLLYPAIGESVDETAVIQGHRFRFVTVDLAARPAAIRDSLLRLVDPPAMGERGE